MGDGTERPSKWIPITNMVDTAHIGKALEEAGELVSILARIQIQGIDEVDPDTGKPNRIALQEELADFRAMAFLLTERFDLDRAQMAIRAARKVEMKREWHRMLLEEVLL